MTALEVMTGRRPKRWSGKNRHRAFVFLFLDVADVEEELRSEFMIIAVEFESVVSFDRFSSFYRLRRTIAWVNRFVFNARAGLRKTTKKTGELNAIECYWLNEC